MTEKTLTTENIKPALDALRGELAPWPVVAMKQDRLNDTQKSAVNSGITSSLVAQIIANTAAIRALESAITGTGLRALVVASLPAIGTQGILYIVPVTTYDPATDADVVNYSNEYIWIVAPDAPVTEGYYEQVGQTGIVINNGQLTITVNGTSVGTFTANQSGDTTAAITVPTNADYVDKTTAQSIAGVKTFSSTINGTASKAIADEDGTSIKTGYVNVAGNQTVSGQKTWRGNQFFTADVYHNHTSYASGNTPSDNTASNIYLADKNNVYLGYLRNVIYTSGRTSTEIRAKNSFKNGVLDPTGSVINSNLNIEIQPSGAKTIYWDGLIRNDVTPYTTNNNSLGSSTNQWSSVYAQKVYLNGTEFGLGISNYFTDNQMIRTAQSIDVVNNPSAEIVGKALRFVDNDRFWSQWVPVWATDGSVRFEMGIANYTTAGIQKYATVAYKVAKDWSALSFYSTHSNSQLGTSSYQWSSVYAQTYYYKGTAWGLDKANTWTGSNTFSSILNQNINSIYSEIPSSDHFAVKGVTDNNGNNVFAISFADRSSGQRDLTLRIYNTDGTQVSVGLYKNSDSSHDFKPMSNGLVNLGTSTNKWKTLNGVNPGALSLPKNSNSASYNIDTKNWTTDGSIIAYTPLLDGWIYINARNDDTNGDSFIIFDDGVSGFGTSVFGNKGLQNNGVGLLCLMMPVNKNNSINIRIKSPGIVSARVYPCLGNV